MLSRISSKSRLIHNLPRRYATQFKDFFGISQSIEKRKIENDHMLNYNISNTKVISGLLGSIVCLGIAIHLMSTKKSATIFSFLDLYKNKLSISLCTSFDSPEWLLKKKMMIMANLLENLNSATTLESKNQAEYIRLCKMLIHCIKKAKVRAMVNGNTYCLDEFLTCIAFIIPRLEVKDQFIKCKENLLSIIIELMYQYCLYLQTSKKTLPEKKYQEILLKSHKIIKKGSILLIKHTDSLLIDSTANYLKILKIMIEVDHFYSFQNSSSDEPQKLHLELKQKLKAKIEPLISEYLHDYDFNKALYGENDIFTKWEEIFKTPT
ncbi:unnamed protein product [Moneuplotes crassus]|uniref:Uncharacterized protein n=1 Tax=Euplotes crassus TaxID=5936 RepID=A0AAD2CWK2_EUPCR|nr:unnamed protein product [Moneuplotes crassus]